MTYLEKLKLELVMSAYHDGWAIEWIKNKIFELEKKNKIKKHKLT